MSKSKYHSRKITVDGIEFDSKKEAKRYTELLLLERAGAIQGLQMQVKYELIPSQRQNGRVVDRACQYVADFVYKENGKTVVEDVKGYRDGGAYRVFTIKRKLMLYIHGIRIKEV